MTSRDSNYQMPENVCNHCEKDTPQVLVSNESNKSYQENHETSVAGQNDDSGEKWRSSFHSLQLKILTLVTITWKWIIVARTT